MFILLNIIEIFNKISSKEIKKVCDDFYQNKVDIEYKKFHSNK